jgi:tetratricopeptide (TPR) repeat protein
MPDGPDRVKQWRVAGALYENALKAAPDRDEAPEAAINGAFAYKQIGDYDKAIEMYRLFIEKYGDEKILAKLEKGDAEEKKKYGDRVKFLNDAYTALSEAYVLFFNYRAAAETSEQIAKIERFDTTKRKLAAYNALVLYSNLGDREKMKAAKEKYYTFKPSLEEKAEIDYVFALADYKQWDERGADSGNNSSARQKGTAAMSGYYDTYKSKKEANRYVVSAAYFVAKMSAASGSASKADEWRTNTISAFNRYRSSAPTKDGKNTALASPEADMAAECDYALLDAEIKKKFDYDTGHHRFSGTVPEVIKKYKADAKDAETYYKKLAKLADPAVYGSAEFLVAAYARQGTLYDSLRTGLFNTKEPALKLFSAQEESTLKQLEESGNDEYVDKALLFRDNRVKLWRDTRDKELTDADNVMVREYTRAVTVAKKLQVRSIPVNKALQRLGFFTDILGDAKMQQYSSTVEGFTYTEGMFQKMRPGMVADPEPNSLPGPLPVVIQ